LNRKLLILNLALATAAIYAGVGLRDRYRAAQASHATMLNHRMPVVPPPAFSVAPPVPPVLPSGYADVAQKMLFDKSRNSTVVVEPPPPPPPPKPMPPLPAYHGQMKLPGQDLIVFLSESGRGPHQPVHIGESIGPFKLLEANSEALTLDWEGKTVTKNLKELVETGGPMAQAAPTPAAAKPAAPAPAQAKPMTGPGADLGGYKQCAANDGYPDGAVVDGYRKVVIPNPFAPTGVCRWDPAGR